MWSPGPGTARALQALGVEGSRIDTPAPDAAQYRLVAQRLGQVLGDMPAGDALDAVLGEVG